MIDIGTTSHDCSLPDNRVPRAKAPEGRSTDWMPKGA